MFPTMTLQPFQTRFIKAAFRSGVDTAALSLPRGNGKSWLAGWLVARALTPGDSMYKAGAEVVLLAGSLEQARIVFNFTREFLEATSEDYSWLDSSTRIGIKHKSSRTRLRVLSSKAKSAFGLVSVRARQRSVAYRRRTGLVGNGWRHPDERRDLHGAGQTGLDLAGDSHWDDIAVERRRMVERPHCGWESRERLRSSVARQCEALEPLV